MTIASAVTFGLSIGGALLGLIWKVASITIQFGKQSQMINTIDERAKDDRNYNEKKFSELYNRVNLAEQEIKKIDERTESIKEDLAKINSKLDRLIERT